MVGACQPDWGRASYNTSSTTGDDLGTMPLAVVKQRLDLSVVREATPINGLVDAPEKMAEQIRECSQYLGLQLRGRSS